MSYDNLSSISQNMFLKFEQQFTHEERRVSLTFDDINFYCSRVGGLIFHTMSSENFSNV